MCDRGQTRENSADNAGSQLQKGKPDGLQIVIGVDTKQI